MPLPELVAEIVIVLDVFDIVIPNPTFIDLYSKDEDVLFIPKI